MFLKHGWISICPQDPTLLVDFASAELPNCRCPFVPLEVQKLLWIFSLVISPDRSISLLRVGVSNVRLEMPCSL